MTFGDAVRLRRKAKGVKQYQLALIVGVSQAKISRIENGGAVTWNLARRLAVIFEIDLNDFKPSKTGEAEAASLSLRAALNLGAAMNIDLNALKLGNPPNDPLEAPAA